MICGTSADRFLIQSCPILVQLPSWRTVPRHNRTRWFNHGPVAERHHFASQIFQKHCVINGSMRNHASTPLDDVDRSSLCRRRNSATRHCCNTTAVWRSTETCSRHFQGRVQEDEVRSIIRGSAEKRRGKGKGRTCANHSWTESLGQRNLSERRSCGQGFFVPRGR